MEPSWRKPAGVIGLLLYLVIYALIVASFGGVLAKLPTALMAIAYLPTLRLYSCPPLLAFGLPAIASLYTAMTLDSALRHWRGQGGAWKGRVY